MVKKDRILKENQGLVCDAVVHVLEQNTGYDRTDIEHPEHAGGPGGVDLLFRLGINQYALEHTKIEAYPNQIQFDTYCSELIYPALNEIKDMPKPGIYELILPFDTRMNARAKQFETLKQVLIQWIREKASTLHTIHPHRLNQEECPKGFDDERTGRPNGFCYDITLQRSVHWDDPEDRDGLLLTSRIAPS